MVTVVIGGSGSGKSAYAESLLEHFEGTKYYLATMKVCDEEGKRKVERHHKLRAGKGFRTIEQPQKLAEVLPQLLPGKNGVLLECMSNLAANEMFTDEGIRTPEETKERILHDVRLLAGQLDEFVIVTNDVSGDGIIYDEMTMEYIRAISDINVGLVEMADRVVEVVVGIPVEVRNAENT